MTGRRFFSSTIRNANAFPMVLPVDVWYDVTDYATLTFATGISQINDKSGNSRHASQVTGANQPTYNATGLSGRPTMTFDGINDFLSSTFTLPSYPFTAFIVASDDTTVNPYAFSYALNNTNYWHISPRPVAQSQIRGSSSLLVSATGTRVNPGVICVRLTSADLRVITEGTGGTLDVAGSHSVPWVSATTLFIGKLRVSGNFFTGNVSEVLIYNRSLNNAEILQGFAYLGNKYSVSVPTSL